MEIPISHEVIKPGIVVEAATIEDEVRRVRHNVASFQTIGRETSNIVMPKGLDVEHGTSLQEAERLTREEYDPTFYSAGIERVQAEVPTILNAIEALKRFQQLWGFELEKTYRIVLTRYGTGGSYDIKTREVIMRTTQTGNFARANPAATPIHEITHLCVENLAKQHSLTFSEKERLVNGIDMTLFPEVFDPNNIVPETERQSKLDMLPILPALIEGMHSTG